MNGWIVVDRIENDIAVCEIDGDGMQMIPLSLLPEGVQAGACLHKEGSSYRLDEVETSRRRNDNADLFRRLMNKDNEKSSPAD